MYYLLIPNKVLESVCSFHFSHTKQSLWCAEDQLLFAHSGNCARSQMRKRDVHLFTAETWNKACNTLRTCPQCQGEGGFCTLKSIPSVLSLRSLSIPPAFLSVGSEQWWNIFIHLGLLETPHVPFGFRDPPTNWNESQQHYPLELKN